MDPAALIHRRHRATALFKPILRAYALGYLSSTTPKVLSCLRRLWGNNDLTYQEKSEQLLRALTGALRLESFPTFCASLVGGSTLLPLLIVRGLQAFFRRLGSEPRRLSSREASRLIQFTAAFVSAWFSFQILNRRPVSLQTVHKDGGENTAAEAEIAFYQQSKLHPHTQPQFAGRTMDLTLFTFTRALDSLACISWAWIRQKYEGNPRWASVDSLVPRLGDSAVFAASAAVVMWAWFYVPERLPRSYGKWIGEVAKVDERLIEALRRARRNIFVYGKDTGQAPLLESMCKDFGWPIEWGDPAKTIPIRCEMVHMGCGSSCEMHAVSRFVRTFKFACATYIPLQIAFRFRSLNSIAALRRAVSDALRSSTFLASFVSIFYYSVCLARTRLGPRLFSKKTVSPQMWDSGLCVGAGCVMCGWSILVEHAKKRQEIALFVAPRAAATVLPRFYNTKYRYRERAAFAISAAVLLTCFRECPDKVRGVFGKVGRSVLN
ncbi:Putative Integral membrane protein (AFU_orthologue; AFUA_2G12300) [Aspergillus calidoustus]|uniref:Putative Integral membrane protein (AFU_orthologue AFUA_2G12300) n=1 Tax=Aspergillus calidoustus TaxID=454130 RepID=A0A0U5FMR3_ASPCI|nr:Putative Integral membrane protein (AFU_orthologue; AFUA_2G12300) [Aspergillus calidoustus]